MNSFLCKDLAKIYYLGKSPKIPVWDKILFGKYIRVFICLGNQSLKKNTVGKYPTAIHNVCPSSDPFFIVGHYIKWVTTSWTLYGAINLLRY